MKTTGRIFKIYLECLHGSYKAYLDIPECCKFKIINKFYGSATITVSSR